MPLDSGELIGFLEEVEETLSRGVTIVAVGGTALTLLGVKPSTRDVDFTMPGEYYDEFRNALHDTPHGFEVDCWSDGAVFSQMLPDDYLDQRDKQDIQACINRFKLRRAQITKRAKQVKYVRRQENYEINLKFVLENFFKRT
jgi:hypothetical protein